jgi:hypothetical protein
VGVPLVGDAVVAGGVVTPSGVVLASVRPGEDGVAAQARWAGEYRAAVGVPAVPGRLVVHGHLSGDGQRIVVGDRELGPVEFARWLPAGGAREIVLVVCRAGAPAVGETSFGSELAAACGVPVTATPGLAWTLPSGRVESRELAFTADGRPVLASGLGQWGTFSGHSVVPVRRYGADLLVALSEGDGSGVVADPVPLGSDAVPWALDGMTARILTNFGDKIIADTKAVIRNGAGNQVVDVAASGGANMRILGMQRDPKYFTPAPDERIALGKVALAASVTGVGNCGEHAAVAFCLANQRDASLPQGIGIWHVSLSVDHAFIALGPESASSPDDVVVVDAWQREAQAVIGGAFNFDIGPDTGKTRFFRPDGNDLMVAATKYVDVDSLRRESEALVGAPVAVRSLSADTVRDLHLWDHHMTPAVAAPDADMVARMRARYDLLPRVIGPPERTHPILVAHAAARTLERGDVRPAARRFGQSEGVLQKIVERDSRQSFVLKSGVQDVQDIMEAAGPFAHGIVVIAANGVVGAVFNVVNIGNGSVDFLDVMTGNGYDHASIPVPVGSNVYLLQFNSRLDPVGAVAGGGV